MVESRIEIMFNEPVPKKREVKKILSGRSHGKEANYIAQNSCSSGQHDHALDCGTGISS
jgi:hypothetical protein